MAIMKWAKIEKSPVVILVRQFRPPLGKDTLEFPAGADHEMLPVKLLHNSLGRPY